MAIQGTAPHSAKPPADGGSSGASSERIHPFEALRAVAMFLGIAYHVADAYRPWVKCRRIAAHVNGKRTPGGDLVRPEEDKSRIS